MVRVCGLFERPRLRRLIPRGKMWALCHGTGVRSRLVGDVSVDVVR